MNYIELTKRQEKILEIVRNHGPITGEEIAQKLNLSRAALRPDLAILTMAGVLGARPRVGYYYTGREPRDVIAGVLGNIRVQEVQSRPIVVRENASVYDAIVTMFIEDVGTIFVVSEGGFLEGLASRKDMLKASMGGKDINKLPVGVVMTRMPNIIVTYPDESVLRAAEKLIQHQVDSLPVVEPVQHEGKEKYRVVGRFTKTNITRLFVSLAGK
ncbi:helix-turn-helix transcriptional regulator [Carboxydothermus pertinax]|uniref:CBS domain protein n=1 Tax=Carboxydothermus pertinax TaxID=870242 RepID=A0A1L8CWE0_9THEO|nr:helix-turn-helix transcriptional regulator [Carboxydothermus pertinax]GAV23169.1 CBS domain protein [Carboxydothermus pertinax]